jgi:diaminopimelate decarboxylase
MINPFQNLNRGSLKFAEKTSPFYGYDMSLLEQTLKSCTEAAKSYHYHVHYALKANFNRPILDKIHQWGIGADCVSGGEIDLALNCGFSPEEIVFAGVGKTDWEIEMALDHGIYCFNVESLAELEVIQEIARSKNIKAPIALRINPNVDANTHHYITTGLSENKFGLYLQSLPEIFQFLGNASHLVLKGLHFHIGSLINDLEVFRNLCLKVNEIKRLFEQERFNLEILNLGGGLGIDYHEPVLHPIPDFKSYFEVFHKFLEVSPKQKVHFELGRSLVGQSGSLITRVLYVKKGLKTDFLIVDAGMNDLLRPSLYQAYHHIENLSFNGDIKDQKIYDVVGPVCESGDFFRKSVSLPVSKRGDILAIRSAGAYGEVMSSPYNLRAKAQDLYF